MKKNLSYLLTAALGVLIIAGVIFFITTNNKTTADTLSFETVNACNKLTLDEARTMLGSSAMKISKPATVRDDIQTSSCTYSTDLTIATVTVRSPLHSTGLKSIENSFHGRMHHYQMISGYGHHAYFDDGTGELNVHDDGSWYTISLRATQQPGSNNPLLEDKAVADKVFN